jgi:RHS repeat-associated protein
MSEKFDVGPNSQGLASYFIFDSATVNGVAMQNTKGRAAEVYTATCYSCSKITDEGFTYSVRGEPTDVYESTPHSGTTYYHITAGYWANGALESLSGNITGVPTQTYGVDGEGRPYSVTAGTGQNPVASTTYNLSTYTATVNFGSLDSDVLTFDPNTGRMKQYTFNVGSKADTGVLSWNLNGSLGQLAITDTVAGTSDSQTCNYTHDDLARIASVNCGSSIWTQTFGYDVFGNISKSGSSSFLAGYVLANGSTNNEIQSLPGVTVTYDADGRLTNDGTHSYAWDSEGKMVSVDTTTITFDALGRMVEKSVSGTYTQIVYSPLGVKYATMSAQTLQKAFVPLPLGSTAVYTSSGLAYYRHKDHLGSSRFASTPSRTMYSSTAYAPYGEPYKQAGTTDLSYTGQDQDTVSGMHDFLDRRFMTVQGRWLSPDPMGLGAVDPTNPQTWNRYAYVMNNPMALLDPFGDECYDPDGNDTGATSKGTCQSSGGTMWADPSSGLYTFFATGSAPMPGPTGTNPEPNPAMDCSPGTPCYTIATSGHPPDFPAMAPPTMAAANNFGQGPTKPPSDPSHPPKPGTMTCPGELLAGAMRALGCFYEFACPSGQVYQGMQKCSITDPYGYKLCPATSTIQISPGQEVKVGPPPPGFCGPVKPN